MATKKENNKKTSDEDVPFFAMDCPCKGKNLDKLIQPSILLALSKKSQHGFTIISELEKSPLCHGNAPDATGVYRYLKKMEEAGLLTSEWEIEGGDKPKRVYAITANGRKCLANWSEVLENYARNILRLVAQIQSETE
jgi:DNA-binding PadR family transcriptional regulator